MPDEVKNRLRQVTNELLREIERYMNECGIEYVVSNIEYTNKNAKDNYVAYLLSALKKDWAKNMRIKQEEQNKYERARE